MGRQRGFFETLAADRRRRERRLESMQSRAFEREMVRSERAQERARIQAERAAQRQKLAKDREVAVQRKQEAKDAQITEWRLECEEHQEHETDIDRIANESPEVEDREKFYRELAEPRVFVPDAFVEPVPPNADAEIGTLKQTSAQELRAKCDSFRPDLSFVRWTQLALLAAGTVGAALWFLDVGREILVPQLVLITSVVGLAIEQRVALWQAAQQRLRFKTLCEAEVEKKLQGDIEKLRRNTAAAVVAARDKARAAYNERTEAARIDFERNEAERSLALEELVAGDLRRMHEGLESLLPLELPVPCEIRYEIPSSSVVALEIDAPEASALPLTEARLLASGKVSYKDKTPKRLREQYLRVVTGLALRHASEVMLNLPTCQRVDVQIFRTTLEPSLGHALRRCVLQVSFDYPVLGPITMDGIDPVSALKHFQHELNCDRDMDPLPIKG